MLWSVEMERASQIFLMRSNSHYSPQNLPICGKKNVKLYCMKGLGPRPSTLSAK
jgi:hypothetical protein